MQKQNFSKGGFMPKNTRYYRKIKYPDKVTKPKHLVFVRIFLFRSAGSKITYFPTAPLFYLFQLVNFIAVSKHFCLSFVSFLPIFYLNYIYYFGLLIFCCQIVAVKLIINMFLFKSNYYVNFPTPLVILLYLFHTNLLFQ